MKNFLGALAFATAFTFAQSASALIITATLDSFESTPISVSGIGTGGGRASFTLTGSDAVIPTNLSSVLDASFQAVCLEPNEFISTGVEYQFLVTDLAFAPTATGGMGVAREALVEAVLGRLGVTTVEAMDLTRVGAVTGLVYEAGYEASANPLDLGAGTAVVTGVGTAEAQVALASFDPQLTNVDAFALINLGPVGGFTTRTVFQGQDFVVTQASVVPSPGPLALMGFGMLGLVGLRKFV